MACHGVDAPLRVEPMKAMPSSPFLGGKSQATEVVSDKLEVPKANSITEEESTAR
jgi:hypothetical protein